MAVYERVRDYIDRKGLKQSAIAIKADISKQTLSAMLSGRRKMYADDLQALCKALDVRPELFIECNSNVDAC